MLRFLSRWGRMGQSERKVETFAERVHPTNMGRDELNLAEFPLATLADKAPRDCKTLAFEDQIWDPESPRQSDSASYHHGLRQVRAAERSG